MSWVGWCILCAAVYVGYLLLRAAIDGVNWLLNTLVREPREREQLRKLARERRKAAATTSAPPPPDPERLIPMVPKDQEPGRG